MFKLSFKNFLLPRIAPISERLATALFLIHFTKCAKLRGRVCIACANLGVQNSELRVVQNSEPISMKKSITFAGATTVCANLRGVQITGVCKLRGFTVLYSINMSWLD